MCLSMLAACSSGGSSEQPMQGSNSVEMEPTETAPAETKPVETVPLGEPIGTFTYTYESGVVTISGTGILDNYAMDERGAVKDVVKDVIEGEAEVQVVLEPGVTMIWDGVFSGCSNMTSITIPEGVTIIGDNAFECCYALTSVTIPWGVTEIGDGVFTKCIS